jgi:class 3 adenylate cyclase
VAKLRASERSKLSDAAFAYVDSQGNRRLPIHDASHVRNALARFGQVPFEDDAARERARMRLLQAAKKHRIVPIGFIANEIEVAQRSTTVRTLPSGFVTLLMTDIEGSTELVRRVGSDFGRLIDEVWSELRAAVRDAGGFEVEARADEFFAAFEAPRAAVDAAVAVQQRFGSQTFLDSVPVRLRAGVHSGYPTSTNNNYVGLDVNVTSRITSLGHGGQIVVSANTRDAVRSTGAAGVRFLALGEHRLKGIADRMSVYQVAAKGLPTRFPPLRGGLRL